MKKLLKMGYLFKMKYHDIIIQENKKNHDRAVVYDGIIKLVIIILYPIILFILIVFNIGSRKD